MMRRAGQTRFYSQVSASQGSISSSSLGAKDPISVDFCLHSVCKCGKERCDNLDNDDHDQDNHGSDDDQDIHYNDDHDNDCGWPAKFPFRKVLALMHLKHHIA